MNFELPEIWTSIILYTNPKLPLRLVCKLFSKIIEELPILLKIKTIMIHDTKIKYQRLSEIFKNSKFELDAGSIREAVPIFCCASFGGANPDDGVKFLFLENFDRMISLDISEAKYSVDDDILKKLTWLKSLVLSDNDIITDSGISTLTNLQSLRANKNSTNKTLALLTNLKYLNLDLNFKVNSSLKYLTNLTKLSLGADNIVSDINLKSLHQLRSLYISYSRYTTDDSIIQLTNLIKLSVQGSNLITDKSIIKLTKLLHLYVGANTRNITDNSVKYLTQLRSLGLIANENITGTSIHELMNLEYLKLQSNNNICYNDIIKLTSLNLSHNTLIRDEEIEFIPVVLPKLKLIELNGKKIISEQIIKQLQKVTKIKV